MFEKEKISLQLENGDIFPLEKNGWRLTPQNVLEVRGGAIIRSISMLFFALPDTHAGLHEGSSLL